MDTNASATSISIARDFSEFPAGRFRADGDASGEAFREDFLVKALNSFERVEVIFDGVAGFGSSFLEEAFGGLVRECQIDQGFLEERLMLSTNEQALKDFVQLALRYIQEAEQAEQRRPAPRCRS